MPIVEYMEKYGFEQVVVCVDRDVGLKAFIAIHDTTLGPALGGCRIWRHPSEEEALKDVMRLARAMTYKNAAAGLGLGGGKALLWADPRTEKSEALLRSFARFVHSLGGRYITTEDVGATEEDMARIRQETPYVVGLPTSLGGSGDPSRATGWGIYHGMKASLQEALGTDSLKGVRVALQGFGKVASHLAEHLLREEAILIATDINRDALQRAASRGIGVLENPDAIYNIPCEVFSPCALGGALNPKTIPRLQCRVVAGGANNQLLTPEDGEALRQRGILYAPDFIINAGGVINISFEIGRPYREEAAFQQVAKIRDTLNQVFALAKARGVSTARAAELLAEERLAAVRKVKSLYMRDQHPVR